MRKAIYGVIFSFLYLSYAFSAEPVGKIIQLINDVDVTSLTSGEKIIPQVGFILKADHKIRTGKRSYAEILLNNGTRIQMRDISVLNISSLKDEQNEEPTRLKLLTGKVRVSVKKVFHKGHTLIVKTPTAIAGIRGTEFGIIATINETKIIVFSGSLEVASSNPKIIKSYLLKDREESDIPKDSPPTSPRAVPEHILNTWFDRYDIDERNRIIDKTKGNEDLIDTILRKRTY
ncbi:MAG: FecR family protein [Spirochaetes bacterium]|nr:FecR family protein [Spirochaetota bacterium]